MPFLFIELGFRLYQISHYFPLRFYQQKKIKNVMEKHTFLKIVVQMQIIYRGKSDDSSLPSCITLSSSQVTPINFKKLKKFKKEAAIPSPLLSTNTCPQQFMNIISEFCQFKLSTPFSILILFFQPYQLYMVMFL